MPLSFNVSDLARTQEVVKHHSDWPGWLGPFSRALTVHLLAEYGGLPGPLVADMGLKPLKACGSIAFSIGAQKPGCPWFCGLGSGVGGCPPRAPSAPCLARKAASSSVAEICELGEY